MKETINSDIAPYFCNDLLDISHVLLDSSQDFLYFSHEFLDF